MLILVGSEEHSENGGFTAVLRHMACLFMAAVGYSKILYPYLSMSHAKPQEQLQEHHYIWEHIAVMP